jgi:hypothetical protein
MLAAVLACEEGTILSHGSAAELLGLWDKQLPVMHVIPSDWSGRKIDGIRWHRVRLPLPDEIEIGTESRAQRSPARSWTWPVDPAGGSYGDWWSKRRSCGSSTSMRSIGSSPEDGVWERLACA